MESNKIPILLFLGVIASFILGITALLVIITAQKSQANLPVLGNVPQFEFIKQDGAPFGLADMMGKINVVDFIFTSCREACPAMSGNMARLYQKFKGADQVQFVSISVDPDRDSLEVLRNYAASFGVNDDRWVFLWQPISEVMKFSEKGLLISATDLPEGHSSKFVLVDNKGQIRGYYDGTDYNSVNQLGRDIASLAKAIK